MLPIRTLSKLQPPSPSILQIKHPGLCISSPAFLSLKVEYLVYSSHVRYSAPCSCLNEAQQRKRRCTCQWWYCIVSYHIVGMYVCMYVCSLQPPFQITSTFGNCCAKSTVMIRRTRPQYTLRALPSSLDAFHSGQATWSQCANGSAWRPQERS